MTIQNNPKHLGSGESYAVYTTEKDASLLDVIPREIGRKESNIENTPVYGYDVWMAHESTLLLNNGLPIAGTLKIVYSHHSQHMVESKSLKLYLNSYDMCKMGVTIDEAVKNYTKQVQSDLEDILEHGVVVYFHRNTESSGYNITDGYSDIYELIEGFGELNTILVTDYNAEKNHLIFDEDSSIKTQTVKYSSNILRSRCEKTHQKDSGSVYIELTTTGGVVNLVSLLKQIISLREKSKFHENCCEKLYDDLLSLKGVERVSVMMLYARRGGIDINPIRSSGGMMIPHILIDPTKLQKKTQMQ